MHVEHFMQVTTFGGFAILVAESFLFGMFRVLRFGFGCGVGKFIGNSYRVHN